MNTKNMNKYLPSFTEAVIVNLIALLVVGFFLLVTLNSCNDDQFSTLTNENELNSENYYTTVANCNLALNAVYSSLKSLDLFSQQYYGQSLVALPHEADYWNAQSRNDVNSADGAVYTAWRGFYRVIAQSNDVLENIPVYIEKFQPVESDVTKLNQMMGQAYFMRAFAYFHMVRLWGEAPYPVDKTKLSIPLILKVPQTRDDMMQPRATVEAVYQQIISDFMQAGSLLPESWDSDNIARVNQVAAKAFLGEVYLYMKDFENSKKYFDEILTNTQYDLVPFSQYDDLFQGKNEFSKESIFELNYTVDMQQNIWENGLGSGIALSCAPPNRGWSNITPHAVNVDRFGSDPRLKVCMYSPTDSAVDVNGVLSPCGFNEFNLYGYSFRKYVPQDYCVYSTNRNSGCNFIVKRLADVYLLYAELMNEMGNDAVALEYLNKVHRRAYGFDHHVAQPSVDFSDLNGIQLRDAIREERFKELFAEGHRWFDIVRWGIVKEEVLKYNVKRKTQGLIIYDDKDCYYPVPLAEVDTNPNMKPSTGYE